MMTATIRHRAHRGVAVVVLAAAPTGCDSEPTADRSSATSTAPAATPIPQPGLVRLGTIDTGLEVIAAAGNDFELTIQPLD
jgi:hypothetical protein